MRELILNALQEQLTYDEELLEEYGDINQLSTLDDESLLEVYNFAVGFRG